MEENGLKEKTRPDQTKAAQRSKEIKEIRADTRRDQSFLEFSIGCLHFRFEREGKLLCGSAASS